MKFVLAKMSQNKEIEGYYVAQDNTNPLVYNISLFRYAKVFDSLEEATSIADALGQANRFLTPIPYFEEGMIVSHFKRELLSAEAKKSTNKFMYKIIAIAQHTETNERLVVYKALYKNASGDHITYARPYRMFISKVDHQQYPHIKRIYRFEEETYYNEEKGHFLDKDS